MELDGFIVWNAHDTVFGSKLFTSGIRRSLVSRDSIINSRWWLAVCNWVMSALSAVLSTRVGRCRKFKEVSCTECIIQGNDFEYSNGKNGHQKSRNGLLAILYFAHVSSFSSVNSLSPEIDVLDYMDIVKILRFWRSSSNNGTLSASILAWSLYAIAQLHNVGRSSRCVCSKFPAICNHRGVMAAWSRKTLKYSRYFCVF